MNEIPSVQILIQSGALGLCFYLIYINRKQSNGQLTKMIDVVDKNSNVMGKLSEKIDELIRR